MEDYYKTEIDRLMDQISEMGIEINTSSIRKSRKANASGAISARELSDDDSNSNKSVAKLDDAKPVA